MSADAIEALLAERGLVLDLAASLTPEEWTMSSDCAGWRVQDVIAHMGATFVAVGGGTTARADPPSDDAERNADAAVDERRGWTAEEVLAEYESASTTAIGALSALQEPPMRDTVVPLGNLGSHPLHLLANALVFDHYCHLRHDLLAPSGPLERDPFPSDDLRLRPTVAWMLGGLPQMCAEALSVVDRPLRLVLDGPGGGAWIIQPGSPYVVIEEAAPAVASGRAVAATITSSAHDFVSWGTKRRDWRDAGVRIDSAGDDDGEGGGDDGTAYAARVLDAFNVI
jgi:uncharacterized protein (TIGR03083 family)